MLKYSLSDADIEKFKTFAVELTSNSPIPGGTVAIFDTSGDIASFAFGYANLASKLPMDIGLKFEIGSISKTLTALLILALADEGLIEIDEPVSNYLTWFDPGKPKAQITIRQLLSHTAGLIMGADHIPDELAQVWSMRYRARSGELGKRFHYSNVGYMVLGSLISEVLEGPLPDELLKRILIPLGISDVRVGVTHSDRSSMATGHWPLHDDRPWLPGDQIEPATWFEVACADGNVAASVGELSKLGQFLLSNGKVDGIQIISEKLLNEMVSPAAPSGESAAGWGMQQSIDSSRYGLGVNVESISGNHVVTHGGGMVGYATFLLADRTSGLGVSVLTNGNGDYPAAEHVARMIHKMMTSSEFELPVTDIKIRVNEISAELFGKFHSELFDSKVLDIEVEGNESGFVQIKALGQVSLLMRTWTDRFLISNPELRTYHLQISENNWTFGPHLLVKHQDRVQMPNEDQKSLVGHYRTYSPWFTNFRIVFRQGSLYLVAPGGVESPTTDLELIQVKKGVYRIGKDPWLPERLVVGPKINASVISVERDGALYSRSFTN